MRTGATPAGGNGRALDEGRPPPRRHERAQPVLLDRGPRPPRLRIPSRHPDQAGPGVPRRRRHQLGVDPPARRRRSPGGATRARRPRTRSVTGSTSSTPSTVAATRRATSSPTRRPRRRRLRAAPRARTRARSPGSTRSTITSRTTRTTAATPSSPRGRRNGCATPGSSSGPELPRDLVPNGPALVPARFVLGPYALRPAKRAAILSATTFPAWRSGRAKRPFFSGERGCG